MKLIGYNPPPAVKEAELIIVKMNTVARKGNEAFGPFKVQTQTDFKAIIQRFFNTMLKGIAGHVLVSYQGKLIMCERDNVDPTKPYVRHPVKYHPEAMRFTSQKATA